MPKYQIILVLSIGLCLCAIGFGIHKKAYKAVAPPIYDPISYYWKSKIVWNAIHQHDWKSAFNQFPSRPPGTALILYPFGFVPSIQSFIFRSTLAPIVIWAIALLIITIPKIKNLKEAIVGAALIGSLISLPIFYHFECPTDPKKAFGISIQWGLVDVLQGSVGGLALGLLYTGIRKNIKSIIFFAWLVGAYSFFIKPSGILVMGSLFLVYVTEIFILFRSKSKIPPKTIIDYFGFLIVGISITAASIWLAFWGGYLSRDIIQTARTASKILIQSVHPPILSQLELLIWPVYGYWWFIPIAMTALIAASISVYSLLKWRLSDLSVRFIASLIIIVSSLYWWVTMAGQEHRYLFPFIMIIMSWIFVPIFFEWMVSLKSRMRYLLIAYCLVPLICTITLLNIKHGRIGSKTEKLFGYNLDVGQYGDEVKMGQSLLQEAVKSERQITIYSIGNYRVGAVEMIDHVNSIENPAEPHHFTVYRINNWISPGIKIKQVLSCDYFLIENSQLESLYSAQTDEMRWQDEESILTKFINTSNNNPNSGIKLIQKGPVLLYKVLNREKFVTACNHLVRMHKWSDGFWIRNSYSRGDFDIP
jgi:hypothetical protein